MGLVKQICKQCGKEFKVRSDRVKAGMGKFCSRKCGAQSRSTLVQRLCKQCGTEFLASPSQIRGGRGKFCSLDCYYIWQRSGNMPSGFNHPQWKGGNAIVDCKQCGKTFEVGHAQIKQGAGKFCSRECKNLWQSKNVRGNKHPNWKPKMSRVCEWCGTEFEKHLCDIKCGRGRFCSKHCMGKWQSEYRKGERGANWHGGDVIQICEWCGGEFSANRGRLARTNARFCSNSCRGRWQSENIVGENHPRWLGGISFEPYTSEFNDALKLHVRNRDDYKCAICGQRGRSVHHINYDKTDNRPKNLITLDRRCHGKTNTNRKYWEILLSPIAIARTETELWA